MARIIVIDDDEQIRSLLSSMLERAGHQVAAAANGDEGIRLYRNQKADLINLHSAFARDVPLLRSVSR